MSFELVLLERSDGWKVRRIGVWDSRQGALEIGDEMLANRGDCVAAVIDLRPGYTSIDWTCKGFTPVNIKQELEAYAERQRDERTVK